MSYRSSRFAHGMALASLVLGFSSATLDAEALFAAVFQDVGDVNALEAEFDIPSAEYQAHFDGMVTAGFRLMTVSGYQVNGQVFFATTWLKVSSGPLWQARHNLTSSQYQNTFNELVGQGYRPVFVDGYTVDGIDRYSAIWEKSSGPAWEARHRMSASVYQNEFNTLVEQGYRVVHVSGYSINGATYFAAIFEKSTISGGWVGHHNISGAQFQQLSDQYAGSGLYPVVVSGYEVNGSIYYAAIWTRPAGTSHRVYRDINATILQVRLNENAAAGRRLTALNGYSPNSSFELPEVSVDRPIIGVEVPSLSAFDAVMLKFVQDRDVKAASLCITRDDKVIFQRAYGWVDELETTAVLSTALFRIASLSKPVTAAVINNLIGRGFINPSDRVFTIGGQQGLLNIMPIATPDPRLADITVQHLLNHTGGWDRAISGDPMFDLINIAETLGVASPPSQEDIVRYVLGRNALDHVPGSTYAYSNFGYLVLGLIAESIAGIDLTLFVQDRIMGPLGIPFEDFELGQALPEDRNPREPVYLDPSTARSVYNTFQFVPFPDGGFDVAAFEAHGGWICTAEAYARFLTRFDLNGGSREISDSGVFYGSMPGTTSVAIQFSDGTNIVALLNQRSDSSGKSYFELDDQLTGAYYSISDWPDQDVSELPLPTPELSVEILPTAFDLSFPSERHHIHILERSKNLTDWETFTFPVRGDGSERSIRLDNPGPDDSGYYRIITQR